MEQIHQHTKNKTHMEQYQYINIYIETKFERILL